MESPAGRATGRALDSLADSPNYSTTESNTQAAVRAVAAGLVYLPHPTDLAFILRRRLDLPRLIWLTTSTLTSLPPDEAEELAEAVLHDLRAGPPIPPFMSIRDEARDWAMFASRAERCHYLEAAWGQLSPDDRCRFLRRAL